MDLSKLKTSKSDVGAVLQLLHPETEEHLKGMSVTVLGQDSAVYRKILLARQQATLNRMSKGKKAAELNAEKLTEDTIDDLVKMTISWIGFELDGKKLDCTPENVKSIYADPELSWLKDQVASFVGDRSNFFGK
jgi:hypothetical protein